MKEIEVTMNPPFQQKYVAEKIKATSTKLEVKNTRQSYIPDYDSEVLPITNYSLFDDKNKTLLFVITIRAKKIHQPSRQPGDIKAEMLKTINEHYQP